MREPVHRQEDYPTQHCIIEMQSWFQSFLDARDQEWSTPPPKPEQGKKKMSIFLLSFVIIKPISCFYTLEISGLIMGLQELISEEGRPVWDLEGRVGRARVWPPPPANSWCVSRSVLCGDARFKWWRFSVWDSSCGLYDNFSLASYQTQFMH